MNSIPGRIRGVIDVSHFRLRRGRGICRLSRETSRRRTLHQRLSRIRRHAERGNDRGGIRDSNLLVIVRRCRQRHRRRLH